MKINELKKGKEYKWIGYIKTADNQHKATLNTISKYVVLIIITLVIGDIIQDDFPIFFALGYIWGDIYLIINWSYKEKGFIWYSVNWKKSHYEEI